MNADLQIGSHTIRFQNEDGDVRMVLDDMVSDYLTPTGERGLMAVLTELAGAPVRPIGTSSCPRCGALVETVLFDTHERWHREAPNPYGQIVAALHKHFAHDDPEGGLADKLRSTILETVYDALR